MCKINCSGGCPECSSEDHKKSPHKHAELIKAWADGAEIEALITTSGDWRYIEKPSWIDYVQYRIKPTPSPYADFKIDEPVMVSGNGEWFKRHFAGVNSDGKATCWPDGTTSWTFSIRTLKTTWIHCRRPTAEELASK